MIDLEQSTLALLFLYSVALGAMLGVTYEVIRLAKMMLGVEYGRVASKLGRARRAVVFAVTFVADVVFWIIFAASSLLLTYNVSGGAFRGMVYVGMLLGGAAYYLTLGRLTIKIGMKLTRLIRKIAVRIIRLMSVPLRAIFYLIVKIYHLTIGKIIGKIVCVMKERRVKGKTAPRNDVALPQNIQKENDRDVTKYRYEREGRISFGRSGDRR